jgi:hypothetical protein
LCGVLIASVLANMAAAAAAWHRYQLLLALPPECTPYGTEALLNADMWFGNLMGWRKAAIVTSVLLLIAWLDSMRTLAETLWPEGQRRRRAWLLFAWGIPVVNLTIPKMFINDLVGRNPVRTPPRPPAAHRIMAVRRPGLQFVVQARIS